MKDNFSNQSNQYAKYRPTYPVEFFNYLNSIVQVKENAWDCGTGNGQIALELARTFKTVYATDISQSQLDNAGQENNIKYSVQPAEKTNFEDHQFDLVTVGQAIHWFEFEKFYSEVRRTAKKKGLICVVGYGGLQVSEEIDLVKKQFHRDIVGAYWDKERKYVDEDYKTIPFPFQELQTPEFVNRLHWSLEQVIGYINTWSAVKHFIQKNGFNPVDKLQNEIEKLWGGERTREVRFPVLLRIGLIIQRAN